ncbi:hypothetical protein SDC9_153463 [bioreactor metagenome]|uniref:Uncharacterized protein n=1 Tax=bioreactor metagenome TaxID=1076179 RepID=A0A645EWF5_9ZZZZ
MGGGNLLKVGGVVLAGKGVVTTTNRCDTLVELAGAHFPGALEHHVFKDVGDA